MARLKKIRGIRVGQCDVNIYRNAEYGEYVVKSLVNGRVQGGPGGGYFTSDKQDARNTAAAMVRRFRGRNMRSVCHADVDAAWEDLSKF